MSETLYAVTATIEGEPVGSMLIANDRDEATTKALGRLPDNARITHVISFCPATLESFTRNALLTLVNPEDALTFTANNLLKIIHVQASLNEALGDVIESLAGAVLSGSRPTDPEFKDDAN